MGQGGLDDDTPRFLFLAITPIHSGQPQSVYERRQSKALQDERYHDHAEREEHDDIAMGERQPIFEKLRQSKGGRQRYDTSHARPPDDKHLAERRSWLVLVSEFGSQKMTDPCAGDHPYEAKNNQQKAEDSAIQNESRQAVFANG